MLTRFDPTETIVRADEALFGRNGGSGSDRRTTALTEEILRSGLALSAAAVVVQTVFHVINLVAFDREAVFLNADDDAGLFAWASSAATFAAAFGSLLLFLLLRDRAHLALGAVLAFFSADDVLAIHERTGDEFFGLPEDWEVGRVLWPAFFLPLLAAGALLLWRVARRVEGRIAAFIRAGLVLLVVAVALETSSVFLVAQEWHWRSKPYETEVILEEGAELVGWIWIAAALTALACEALARRAERPAPGL